MPCPQCGAATRNRYCSPACRKKYKSPSPRACISCGSDFVPQTRKIRGDYRKTCSPTCHHVAAAPHRKPNEPRPCISCGAMYTPKQCRPKQTYCSRECMRKRPNRGERSCVRCGGVYIARSVGQSYCSKRCSTAAAQHLSRERRRECTTTRACRICKQEFRTTNLTKVYCSSLCLGRRFYGIPDYRERVCPMCGVVFAPVLVPGSRQPKYCSSKCCSKAGNYRHLLKGLRTQDYPEFMKAIAALKSLRRELNSSYQSGYRSDI